MLLHHVYLFIINIPNFILIQPINLFLHLYTLALKCIMLKIDTEIHITFNCVCTFNV